jgi:hypothetical protein
MTASPATAMNVTVAPVPAPAEASIRVSPKTETMVSLVQPAGSVARRSPKIATYILAPSRSPGTNPIPDSAVAALGEPVEAHR